jgi:hypothetical protein
MTSPQLLWISEGLLYRVAPIGTWRQVSQPIHQYTNSLASPLQKIYIIYIYIYLNEMYYVNILCSAITMNKASY